jgi:hypothetical protein
MPSVCSVSAPSAASQLNAALMGRVGVGLVINERSATSRPLGLTTRSQEGASSRPLVPMSPGTP